MSLKKRNEIGCINNVRYRLSFDKRKNKQCVDDQYRNKWRWWLWVNDEYIGDFGTKGDALQNIKKTLKETNK